MLDVDISKLLIILGFLGALILVQIIVKRTTFFPSCLLPPAQRHLK